MSLQRRLLLYLLISAPLVWAVALVASVQSARHEVNELFDTEMIRLARQVQVTLLTATSVPATLPPAPGEGSESAGESDVRDLAVAVWDADGRLLQSDREGVQLTRHADATGFVDEALQGEMWRVYYLQSPGGEWLVAAGQKLYERDELVFDLTTSQMVPWLLVLPVLLAAMAWGVRRALAPVRQMAQSLQARGADDLKAVPDARLPAELKPLVRAMNGLFLRIEDTLERERRFNADAAHELRTPLAVLRAQWDVVRRAASPEQRADAEAKLTAGIDRMARLVEQLLALSRLESATSLPTLHEVSWPQVVEQAMSDCLPLAQRRGIELACEWPEPGQHPLPLLGDEALLVVLLRNLLDNAVRYAPGGSSVLLAIGTERLTVENDGQPLPAAQLQRLGERFYRPEGQFESGSGLGVSIIRRIAALHGLEVVFGTRAGGQGVKVTVGFPALRKAAVNAP
jgi:two-component system sensor histidine kinase QseC